MNSEAKIHSPAPLRILKSFSLNSTIFKPSVKKQSEECAYRENVDEILRMRGNSQNPHEKDENFKCQSSESFGESEDWEKFEENFYECCN